MFDNYKNLQKICKKYYKTLDFVLRFVKMLLMLSEYLKNQDRKAKTGGRIGWRPVMPNSIGVSKTRPNRTKRLPLNPRCHSKCSEKAAILAYETLPLRPFGYFSAAQYKYATGKLFRPGLKAVFAQGDSSEIVSKRGFTNSWAMRKYLFNRGKNVKSEMGRAIKKERAGRGQIS